MPLSQPEVIYTHESDLDGFVAGLLLQNLAEKLFGSKPKVLAFHNQGWKQRSLQDRAAWVADMTFEPRMDKPNWVVVDHHPTQAKAAAARLIHDVSKSASLLAYELCREHGLASPALDRLVELSNVADLFLPEHPDFVLANDYANLVKNYGFWNLFELIGGNLEQLIDHPLLEVMAVKRRVENPLGFNWSKTRVTKLAPDVGFVDTVVGNVNLIVHQMLDEKTTPYNVLMTLHRKGNGAVLASLRSRNGDAVRIAEKIHGGGHPNAAGATLPRSVQSVPDAVEFLRKALNPQPEEDAGFGSLENAFAAIEKSS